MSTPQSVYCVLRAGGSGSRLWPLSTPEKPKQFLSFDGATTFFEQTVNHAHAITHNKKAIWVATTQQYASYIHKNYHHIVETIVAEPVGRGTGIADLHALLLIRDIAPDATIVFMHTDAFIPPLYHEQYHRTIERAIHEAHTTKKLILIGVEPIHCAPHYGYVTYTQPSTNGSNESFAVESFTEKPSSEKAHEIINAGNSLWNTGVLVGSVASLYDFMQKFHHTTVSMVQQSIAGYELYESIPSYSTEQLIADHVDSIRIVKGAYVWHDIGTLLMFLTLQQQYGAHTSLLHEVNATNNIAHTSHTHVVCMGINNLCIIEHSGTLFIVAQNHIDTVATTAQALVSVHHPKNVPMVEKDL